MQQIIRKRVASVLAARQQCTSTSSAAADDADPQNRSTGRRRDRLCQMALVGNSVGKKHTEVHPSIKSQESKPAQLASHIAQLPVPSEKKPTKHFVQPPEPSGS